MWSSSRGKRCVGHTQVTFARTPKHHPSPRPLIIRTQDHDFVFYTPTTQAYTMIDSTSGAQLFPLSEWLLHQGPAEEGLQSGIRLWNWTRVYDSDIFTGDPTGAAARCSFSNVVLTICITRNPQVYVGGGATATTSPQRKCAIGEGGARVGGWMMDRRTAEAKRRHKPLPPPSSHFPHLHQPSLISPPPTPAVIDT